MLCVLYPCHGDLEARRSFFARMSTAGCALGRVNYFLSRCVGSSQSQRHVVWSMSSIGMPPSSASLQASAACGSAACPVPHRISATVYPAPPLFYPFLPSSRQPPLSRLLLRWEIPLRDTACLSMCMRVCGTCECVHASVCACKRMCMCECIDSVPWSAPLQVRACTTSSSTSSLQVIASALYAPSNKHGPCADSPALSPVVNVHEFDT